MKQALVIDDHPVTHLGCRRLLNDAGFDTVLEARSSEEGYRLLDRNKPELIILDLALPGVGGLAMIGRLLDRLPNVKILVFSMHEDPIFVSRALEAGAHGYLSKSSTPQDFATAIETIRAGNIYLEHNMATQLVSLKLGRAKTRLDSLTARELQILRLIGKGMSHSAIADQLHVSYKTVVNACAQLKTKTNSATLSELMRLAIDLENRNI